MKTVTSAEFLADAPGIIARAVKEGAIGIVDEKGEISSVISVPAPDIDDGLEPRRVYYAAKIDVRVIRAKARSGGQVPAEDILAMLSEIERLDQLVHDYSTTLQSLRNDYAKLAGQKDRLRIYDMPQWRKGCNYMSDGFCNKCGKDHNQTYAEAFGDGGPLNVPRG